MKWKLNSDNCLQNEISDTKSMSFTENEKTEIITGNKFSLPKYNNSDNDEHTIKSDIASSSSSPLSNNNRQKHQQKYKPRTSNDILAELELKRNKSNQNQHHNYDNHHHYPAKRTQSQKKRFNNTSSSILTSSQYENNTDNDNINKSQIFMISSNQIVGDSGNSSPDIDAMTISNILPSDLRDIIHNDDDGQITTNDNIKPISSSSQIQTKNNNNQINSNSCLNDHLILENTTNEFHPYVNSTANPSTNGSLNKNGSTAKLLPATDDQSSTQSKCSVLRNLILCICLNITYANIVRFPRELDTNGSVFLVPYFILLILVGLPIILLEISIGQFLGQGAANSWRSSPILKGACMISRFAAWLSSIWISLQAIMATLYIGMLIFKSVPFSSCVRDFKAEANGYKVYTDNGQDCIKKTFLVPVWENPIYFGILIIILIFLWLISMLCTHNAKVFRRSTFFFGLIGFVLLIGLTGWEVHKSLDSKYFPELWPFDETKFAYSNLWFNALVQVIYSTNIGFGIMPVITGKFLYKGDAVRTSIVYICFNLLINAIAVTLFMVQYDNRITEGSIMNSLNELKSLTAIYDNILIDYENINITIEQKMLGKIIACLIYTLIVISSIISIIIAIYTSSRLVPRHPNYILSLVALTTATAAFVMPEFALGRILDTRIIGTLIITALVFDLIATIWIYGTKNIYTDLEFSIGRPIFKIWLYLWCIIPVILTGILLWWCVDDDQFDILYQYIPRWSPIGFVIIIIILIAGIEIFKQVDYNFFGMICEAAKPAKEWGPADPLARHAWKQWRSVCQDTGHRDFTLRRRGTRDYTHSIKKGQYSSSAAGQLKYGIGSSTTNWKSASVTGNSSPNYSGSVFGDSAIEEDMSIDKYSGVNQNFVPFNHNQYQQQNEINKTTMRYSSRSRKISHEKLKNLQTAPPPPPPIQTSGHKEILYIRRSSNDRNNPTNSTGINNHSTRIEITPSNESITYGIRNPMARTNSNASTGNNNYKYNMNPSKELSDSGGQLTKTATNNLDHICWRKFSVNSEEYSTEL